MSAISITEKFGQTVRLTDERWSHIIARHPEIRQHKKRIRLALADPDFVVRDNLHPGTSIYHKRFPDLFHQLIVVANLEKGIVVTAYISGRIKSGEVIWPRK
jgi:hypothetical protein